jgi:hypothetical protein
VKRSWSQQRARLFAEAAPQTAAPAAASRPLVGQDFARTRVATRRAPVRRFLLPALLGAVVAALLLASLRTAILRTGYELAAAMKEESALLDRHRSLAVEIRELRDPGRLHQLAREMGLSRPEAVIDLAPREPQP